jgi:hypothetical protein
MLSSTVRDAHHIGTGQQNTCATICVSFFGLYSISHGLADAFLLIVWIELGIGFNHVIRGREPKFGGTLTIGARLIAGILTAVKCIRMALGVKFQVDSRVGRVANEFLWKVALHVQSLSWLVNFAMAICILVYAGIIMRLYQGSHPSRSVSMLLNYFQFLFIMII